MKINELFKFHNAKSKGFEDYPQGDVPFVTNGFDNNGIVGYVKPRKQDKVFNFEGICISAFCEATVQKPPFLPRGNGGSGLLVLEPIEKVSYEKLTQIAAYVNVTHRWKFSYGRMANEDRVKDLKVDISSDIQPSKKISELLPQNLDTIKEVSNPTFTRFNITELFDLKRGDFHALDKLKLGNLPTVSRVAENNGIAGYYKKPKKAQIYPKGTITVATTTGDAFVQLDDFIATDNVVILIPKQKFTIDDLFFITAMINQEKWRVSYGRQCYKTIFAKTNIYLPITKDGQIDHEYMQTIVSNSYNFKNIARYLT